MRCGRAAIVALRLLAHLMHHARSPPAPPLPLLSLRDAQRRRRFPQYPAATRANPYAYRIFHGADHPSPCAQNCAMIHLLLLIGAVGASSSASIEQKSVGGVVAGSSVEIDAPGRALAAGKCCKRAAKHKRKKLQLKAKWQECEEAAAAAAECTGAADAACTVADAADAGTSAGPTQTCEL